LPSGLTPYVTGFAASSPVVDQGRGLIITSLLVNADTTTNTATEEAVAFNAKDGSVAWVAPIGSGQIPYGYTSATPFMGNGEVVFADPVSKNEVALDPATGQQRWSTALGEQSKAPGVIVRGAVVQPAGSSLFTLDAKTGKLLKKVAVGGSFKNNAPTVVGGTLYVGNAWGWVMAYPLDSLGVPHGRTL
jgi:outer membrane protein assembly factor BamB